MLSNIFADSDDSSLYTSDDSRSDDQSSNSSSSSGSSSSSSSSRPIGGGRGRKRYGGDKDLSTPRVSNKVPQEEDAGSAPLLPYAVDGSSFSVGPDSIAGRLLSNQSGGLTFERVKSEKSIEEDGAPTRTKTGAGTVAAPARSRRIRKRWNVEDTSDPSLFDAEVPDEHRACTFPFELDDFQKRAIRRVHRGDYVLVAAHTSAGKTVIGEYAISMALMEGRRAIYTSPIKALSNQKFQDFRRKWPGEGRVGIITGDVSINPDALILIMTTEILRTMIYKGSETVDGTDWVIFDEVHYINDPERGVVWEEVIILLPESIKLVMLSATVPNVREFADWIGRTRKKTVYTVQTAFRPVPLMHYIYHQDAPYCVMSSEGEFLAHKALKDAAEGKLSGTAGIGGEAAKPTGRKTLKEVLFERKPFGMSPKKDEFGYVVEKVNSNDPTRPACRLGVKVGMQVVEVAGVDVSNMKWEDITQMFKETELPVTVVFSKDVKRKPVPTGAASSTPKPVTETQRLQRLIKNLEQEQKLPCAIFVFSRRKVDHFANNLYTLDLTDESEKSKIHVFFKSAISSLSEHDKKLPQIIQTMDLVKRGIGMHHGGLLPLVKEINELLFSRSLVKVLFATETFAMGVNMPARSVVFTSIRKHDGSKFRTLIPSEYTQMAGRAGRRGLDDIGHVYLFYPDELPDLQTLSQMMMHKANKLESQFRITYRMILAMARYSSGKTKLTDMVSSSFLESHRAERLPTIGRDLNRAKLKLSELPRIRCTLVDDDSIPMTAHADIRARLLEASAQLHLFLWDDRNCEKAFCVGRVVTVDVEGQTRRGAIRHLLKPKRILQLVILSDKEGEVSLPRNKFVSNLEVPLEKVMALHDRTLEAKLMHTDSPIALTKAGHALQDIPHQVKPLALNKLSKELEFQFFELLLQQSDLIATSERSPCYGCALENEHLITANGQLAKRREIEELEFILGDSSLGLMPQMEAKVRMLVDLGFLEMDGDSYQCTLKGKCAVEVIASDQLTLCEVLFNNLLGGRSVPEVAAVISSFVFPDKVDEDEWAATDADEEMAELRRKVLEIHAEVGKKQAWLGVECDIEEWQKVCNFSIARLIHAWTRGVSFLEIVENTWIQEGTIVRAIVRLEEMLRKLIKVAKILDNEPLENQLAKASEAIRRDIVFAQSLYLQRN